MTLGILIMSNTNNNKEFNLSDGTNEQIGGTQVKSHW